MASEIESLLARRLKPVQSPPNLHTINGFGCRLYGKTAVSSRLQRSDDGPYITTCYITIAYIPVIPIRRYLIEPISHNKYRFLGKLPLRLIDRLQLLFLGFVLIALVLLAKS
jgi:hypothetical protein